VKIGRKNNILWWVMAPGDLFVILYVVKLDFELFDILFSPHSAALVGDGTWGFVCDSVCS
jgi:hypothetical protein